MTRSTRNLSTCVIAAALLLPAFCLRGDDSDTSSMGVPVPNQPLPVNALLGAINGKPLFVEDILRPIDADLRRIARVAQTGSDFARRHATQSRSRSSSRWAIFWS